MLSGVDRFLIFVAAERSIHAKRFRVSAFVCVLLLALLARTQWSSLRPGLAILLLGQLGVVLALCFRINGLSKILSDSQTGLTQPASPAPWFDGEELFVGRLAIFESVCQMLGLVVLGYGFWAMTGSLWLALAIGVIYPATMYLGITQRTTRKGLQQLRSKKEEIVSQLN